MITTLTVAGSSFH